MKNKMTEGFVGKALMLASKAGDIGEAIAVFETEMAAYEALQSVKVMPDIETATLVLEAKISGCHRFAIGNLSEGFTPEEGDIVRGAFQNFEEGRVAGFGEVNIQNLAEALGRKETSVIAAMRWIRGANQDRLIRKVPDSVTTVQVLQAIAC